MHFYYHPQFVVLPMQPVRNTKRVTLEKLEWLLGYNIIAFLFCQVNSGIFENIWGICWNRARKPRDVLKVEKFYYKKWYTKMQTLEWDNLSWFIQTYKLHTKTFWMTPFSILVALTDSWGSSLPIAPYSQACACLNVETMNVLSRASTVKKKKKVGN